MADLGTLLLAGLALKALGSKSAPQKVPDPPPQPDSGGGGGIDAAKAGSLAATGATALLGLLKGTAGGGTTVATTTGTVAGTGGGAATGGSTATTAATVGVGSIGLGGALVLGWGALLVINFIVINLTVAARVGWLRYRGRIHDMNERPMAHLHHMERTLLEATARRLALPEPRHVDADDFAIGGWRDSSIQPPGPGSDPRLEVSTVNAAGDSTVAHNFHFWRQIYENPLPFTSTTRKADWRLLQMCARLVAFTYVAELGGFARGMLSSFPGLGGNLVSQWGAPAAEVWGYPLLGGGAPDKGPAEMLAEVRALGPSDDGVTVDHILASARLAALLHVASTVQLDPEMRFPWNPIAYASALYSSFALTEQTHHVRPVGASWFIDPVYYRVPCQSLWLDIDALKAGYALQPFKLDGIAPQDGGALRAEDFRITALRALV